MPGEFYYNERDFDLTKKMKTHNIKPQDIELINEYIAFKKDVDHITDTSARRIVNNLIVFIRYSDKPIAKMRIDDALKGIRGVNSGFTSPSPNSPIKSNPKPLELNTKRQIVIAVKGLIRWAIEKKKIKITLEELEFNIKVPEGKDITETINPEDILTEDEILLMASHALTERDRTILLVTYETGCRIGEIARARWKDAVYEEIGDRDTFKFYIRDSKNSQKRYARLTLSASNLVALKNVMKPKSDDELIFTTRGQPLQHITVYHVFENVAKRAGITKPVNPHAFRHARATNMLRQGWSETAVKKQLWNNVNTPMLKTYVALGNDAIDAETLKHAGIKEIREKAAEKPPENRVCSNCNFVNNASIDFCGKCGNPLTPEGQKQKKSDEEEAAKLAVNPAVLQKMIDDAVKKQLDSMNKGK